MEKKPPGNALGILSSLLLITWVACLLTVGSIIVKGGSWSYIITVGNPRDPLLFGSLAFFLWYLLRGGTAGLRPAAVNLLLLSLSLSLSLLVGELAVRAYLRSTQGFNSLEALRQAGEKTHYRPRDSHALVRIVRLSSNRNLVYELRPNMKRRFGGKSFRTNSHGMRDSLEYEREKMPGTTRIIGVGDSGMFGWSTEQDEDYLSVLEDLLSRRGGRYEVLNLAVPGYNTYQEVESLVAKGLAFEPDIVIIGWNNNDFDIPFFLYKSREYREKDVSYLSQFLFRRKEFWDATRPLVFKGHRVSQKFVASDVIANTGSDGVRRALSKLKALGGEFGFKVLLFGTMSERAVDICREIDLPFYNVREEIPEGTYPEEYALYFMHPRAPGHRILSERLERHLLDLGWL